MVSMAKKTKGKKSGAATAAVALLTETNTPFQMREYEHVEGVTSFGEEAAKNLGASEEQVFKTLLIVHEKDFAVAIVPVSGKLNIKAAAAALMFSLPETGTIATAKSFSCTISRVLNTCSSEAPRFFAASSPKEVTPSTCSYSRIWKGVFVSVSSATAAVAAPLFLPLVFLAIDTILRKSPCAVTHVASRWLWGYFSSPFSFSCS